MVSSKSKKFNDIIDSALSEFAHKTFDDASLNNIIKQSQTSKGTFYYYFKDKDDLYIQLIKKAIKTKWDYINTKISDYKDTVVDSDIFIIFKEQAKYGMDFSFEYPLYYKLAKQLINERGKPIYDKVSNELDLKGTEILKNLIEASYEKGVFLPQYDKEFILRIMSFHFEKFDEILLEDDLEKVHDNLNKLIFFLKRGLCNDEHDNS